MALGAWDRNYIKQSFTDTLRKWYGKVHENLTPDQTLQPEKTFCSYLCLQIPRFSIIVEKNKIKSSRLYLYG